MQERERCCCALLLLQTRNSYSTRYKILNFVGQCAARSNVPEIEISLAALCHSEIDNYVYACPGTDIMICPGEDANGDSPPVGYRCRQQAVLTHDEGGRVAEEETGGLAGVSEGNEGAA